jgi:hypothetical protein
VPVGAGGKQNLVNPLSRRAQAVWLAGVGKGGPNWRSRRPTSVNLMDPARRISPARPANFSIRSLWRLA